MTTAVTQGTELANAYPFSAPSEDVRGVLSDFYLNYLDDLNELVLPLQVSWLYGLGTQPAAPPGWAPVPVHDFDVLVRDANAAVVFDSTLADFTTLAWGARTVIEWKTDTATCRAVTGADPAQWPTDIVPTNGNLDGRTFERTPLRVRSLTVALASMTGGLALTDGRNVGITVAATQNKDGGRRVTQITFDATPGQGLGAQPGCTAADLVVRRINGVGPGPSGNFILDVKDCYRNQLPVTIVSDDPLREASYGDVDLTASSAAHAMRLANDCPPCCPCSYYERTYKGLAHVWNIWSALARTTEAARDTYAANRASWEQGLACRQANAGKLTVLTDVKCALQMAGSFCNVALCCLHPVELRFTHQLYEGEELVDWATVSAAAAYAVLTTPAGSANYVMGGNWPIFKASVPSLSPGNSALVQYRLFIDDCTPTMSVKTTYTVHAPSISGCELAAPAVPLEIQNLWADVGDVPLAPARVVLTKLSPLGTTGSNYRCGQLSTGGSSDTSSVTAQSEVPSGDIDGVNNSFTLAHSPGPHGLLLFLNGLLQKEGVDYALSGTGITFTAGNAPHAGDLLLAYYLITG